MEIYLTVQNGRKKVNKTNCRLGMCIVSLTQVAVDDLAKSVDSHIDGVGS